MTKIWFDEDLVELRVEASDGSSFFSSQVYVAHSDLAETVAGLARFKTHVHGGIFNIRMGEFGPEYASGALHVRLHFQKSGKINITCKLQGDFKEFSGTKVASEALLYLVTQPALLDEFIDGLTELSAGKQDEAVMYAV